MATFIDKEGSIFESGADVLVCPVNCTPGVMGAGLAREFVKRWPTLKALHRDRVARGTLGICTPDTVWATHDGPRVVLFPTKRDWRAPSRLGDIRFGMSAVPSLLGFQRWTRHSEDGQTYEQITRPAWCRSIAFPALGCGLGGLQWEDVRPLIVEAMAPLDITVMLYAPKEGDA